MKRFTPYPLPKGIAQSLSSLKEGQQLIDRSTPGVTRCASVDDDGSVVMSVYTSGKGGKGSHFEVIKVSAEWWVIGKI